MNNSRCLLCLLIFAYSQQTFGLGRLFMTPEQRIELEHDDNATPVATQKKVKNSQNIHINGFIKPKHSTSTIWVNGKTRSKQAANNYYVHQWVSPNHQISIELQEDRANLKPGQTLDIKSRVVKEAFAIKPQVETIVTPNSGENNNTLTVLQKAKEINKAIAEADVE